MESKRCRFICKQTHILDFENTPINICSPLSLFEVVVHPLVARSNTFPLMFFSHRLLLGVASHPIIALNSLKADKLRQTFFVSATLQGRTHHQHRRIKYTQDRLFLIICCFCLLEIWRSVSSARFSGVARSTRSE